MLYKAEQNDASLTFHKNEQTETSDRLVKTSDPLISRLRQHTFSAALSQLYLTRSGKSSSSSETRRSRHSIATARHGPIYISNSTFLRLRILPANEFFSRLFTEPQCGISPIFLPSLNLTWFILSATQCISTRQAMHYKRNIEKRSRNHCCHRKAISIKYNNNNNNIYLLQLGCHLVAVVILHVYQTWNWLLLNLSREGYMRSM